MSGSQVFALCIDCWEFNYGITDRNGVFTRDSASSNHWDHAVHVFRSPEEYPPPIRTILASLQAGLPISNGRMEMFSLACALEALQPTNGRKPSGDARRAEEAEPHACDSPLDRSESRETPPVGLPVAPDRSGGLPDPAPNERTTP